MKLTFYNHFGNGDLIESRQFVLAWMSLCGVTTANYAHKPQYLGSFHDLPQLHHTALTRDMNPGKAIIQQGNTWMVNTWVGRAGMNGYVLQPGVGCVLERIKQMWDDMTVEAGLPLLPGTLQQYLPTVDYTRVFIADALREYLEANKGRKLVLVCNGKTTSHQADNFDYHPMLEYLPQDDGVRYLFTERALVPNRPDVVFTDDLTQRMRLPNHPGWDLSAISYLSRHCDVIIGRCSGAHVYAQVAENWYDGNKTLVCLTHHRNGACFVRHPESLGLKMRVLWSKASTAWEVAELIKPLLGFSVSPVIDPPVTRKLFMAVARFKEPPNHRKLMAQLSWKAVERQGVTLCELWQYPRTAKSIGDRRELPFLKDVLQNAMNRAGDDDIIFLVNDDIYLHPALPERLRKHISTHNGPVSSQRCEFVRRPFPPSASPPSVFAVKGVKHPGRDLFAFTKRWLVDHWESIGDAILGASEVDYMLAILIRLHYGIKTTTLNIQDCLPPAELERGYISHQYHSPVWQSRAVINTAPSQIHNRKLLRTLATERGLDIEFGAFDSPNYKLCL